MRRFPDEKELVAAYWRKLARSIGAAYKSRKGALAGRAAHALQTHGRGSRGNGVAKGIAARQAAH